MVVVDGQGVPVGSQLCSASPAEVKLADSTLRCCPARLQRRIRRVVADKADDSDGLDRQLMRRGIELIAPHKRNRKRPATQDKRRLRRYRKRWKIERTFAWLGNYHRLVVRWDRSIISYQAFFHLACLLITARYL
jgi:transposase